MLSFTIIESSLIEMKWNVMFQDVKPKFYRYRRYREYRRNLCMEQGDVEIERNQISQESKPSPPPSYTDVTNPPPYSIAIHIWHLLHIYDSDKTVQIQM